MGLCVKFEFTYFSFRKKERYAKENHQWVHALNLSLLTFLFSKRKVSIDILRIFFYNNSSISFKEVKTNEGN